MVVSPHDALANGGEDRWKRVPWWKGVEIDPTITIYELQWGEVDKANFGPPRCPLDDALYANVLPAWRHQSEDDMWEAIARLMRII